MTLSFREIQRQMSVHILLIDGLILPIYVESDSLGVGPSFTSSCVTSGKLVNLPVPPLSHPQNGTNYCTSKRVLRGLSEFKAECLERVCCIAVIQEKVIYLYYCSYHQVGLLHVSNRLLLTKWLEI